MGEQKPEKTKKHICAGLLAHVDAGKTTLSESILYLTGSIRKLGRVDNKDAFLDTYSLERERGITIFSKQAEIVMRGRSYTLLDTPGHVDFSAEMERTLQVLDYAVLVISGADGVQGHTQTLWRLLARYEVPTFIFVNKMDQNGTDRRALMEEIRQRLGDSCVDFSEEADARNENLAMCDEKVLEAYLEKGTVTDEQVRRMITGRKVFPCFFGSALKLTGVQELLDGIAKWTEEKQYPETFGARVFKIARDAQGGRLTYMKITGGSLKVKAQLRGHIRRRQEAGGEAEDTLSGKDASAGEWEEKVNQIRIYNGTKFETVDAVSAGTVCAVTGLTQTQAGDGLGAEAEQIVPLLEPVLTYRVELPEGSDLHKVLHQLRQLEEEEPELHIVWDDISGQVLVQLMGEIQTEILQQMIHERFGLEVKFGTGQIVYKEAIAAPVEGVGHFEPLRHYAEVHLLMEPLEAGSGLVFDTVCSENMLDRNWQRLILTHLAERDFPGVLTGSPLTDVKITLLAGRAHLKHTEGGDFRQATYRAVRQGLRKTQSILLEPWYDFELEVPQDMTGRAMADIQRMGGSFELPQTRGDLSLIAGKAPVSEMKGYMAEVNSYTRGYGHLSCSVAGYEPCHDAEKVMEETGYRVDEDTENTADSVFCSHGAGYLVPWDQVDDHVHIILDRSVLPDQNKTMGRPEENSRSIGTEDFAGMPEAPLQKRTQGSIGPRVIEGEQGYQKTKSAEIQKEYLVVDGYNIIFAWEELKSLAKTSMDAARTALIEILSNYQGYRRCKVIIVFDAYKIKGGERRQEKHGSVDVVFTKEGETADTYIERLTYEMNGKYRVRVATSDRQEQIIALGNGAFRLSASELKGEIERTNLEISSFLKEYARKNQIRHRNNIKIPKK